jgi:ABC-type phosphate transport system substrate-binding protein
MPWQRVAEIGEQIADALAHAHENGIVHRDLKPDNVLLTGRRAIVTDFGIARILDAATRLTTVGTVMGTPQYMAPEQFRGGDNVPAAADMWALGATLYHALEGTPPYDGPTFAAVIAAVIEQPAPPPPRHAGPLRDLLDRLLAKDPGQRVDAETATRELAGLRSGPVTGNLDPVRPPPGGSVPTAVLGSNGGQATRADAAGTAAPSQSAPGQSASGPGQPTAGPGPAATPGPNGGQATRTHVFTAAAPGQPASGPGTGLAASGPGQPASGPGGGQRRRTPDPAGPPSNRRRLLIGASAGVALVVLLSVGIYLATKPHSSGPSATSGGSSPATSRTGSPAAGGGPSGTAAAAASTSPQCAAGSLQVFGSSAFENIVKNAAAAYTRACKNSAIEVNQNITGQDSAFGVTTVDTAAKSNSPSAKSMIAMYDGTTKLGPNLAQHALGVLIYAVVAHKGLFPGSNITSAQLVSIFLNHGDPGKVVVGRKPGSATHLTFFTKILHAQQGRQDPADVIENDSAAVTAYVSKKNNAIGYGVALQDNPQVSLLAIDKAQPSKANVLNGTYKFWTVEHLYTAPQPTALVTDFLDYLPRYIQSHPQGDFITCSDAATVAGAGCRQ